MHRGGDNPWKPHGRGITPQKLSAGEPGRAWSDKRLFVLGDSHAGAYAEMASLLRERQGVSIYLQSLGGGVCSLIRPQQERDRAIERSALEALRQHGRPGDIVLLAGLRVLRLGDQWATFDLQEVIAQRDSEQAETDRKIAVEEGKAFIRQLEEMGLVVIIEAPKPVFASPAFRCSDWFNRMNPVGRQGFVMDRDFLPAHRAAAMRSIAEVQQAFPQVRVWDPFWVFCSGNTCSAFDGDKPLFFDGDHLKAHGNRKLYADFVRSIDAVWGGAASVAERLEGEMLR